MPLWHDVHLLLLWQVMEPAASCFIVLAFTLQPVATKAALSDWCRCYPGTNWAICKGDQLVHGGISIHCPPHVWQVCSDM